MNTPHLIPLHDGRLGLRAQLSVSASSSPARSSLGEGGSSPPPPILDLIASDESIDRYGEIISAAGWKLDNYRRNPVFQNAHQYGDIIHTLGRALATEVRAVSGRQALCQRIEFAVDVNPVARIAYGLYRGNFLNAVSVGFIPLRWQDGNTPSADAANPPDAQPPSKYSRKYLQQELLEVSAVAIPANPNALTLGLKSGAVTKSDLQDTLDLLRSVVASSSSSSSSSSPVLRSSSEGGSLSPSDGESVDVTDPHPFILTPELFQLARELRRILRRS